MTSKPNRAELIEEAREWTGNFLDQMPSTDLIRRLASALSEVGGGEPPEGWVLVPREPTEAMLKAARRTRANDQRSTAAMSYRAMIASAPPTPPGDGSPPAAPTNVSIPSGTFAEGRRAMGECGNALCADHGCQMFLGVNCPRQTAKRDTRIGDDWEGSEVLYGRDKPTLGDFRRAP